MVSDGTCLRQCTHQPLANATTTRRANKRANDFKVAHDENKKRLETALKDQRLMARKVGVFKADCAAKALLL